ncbi:MAG: hypothetical protein KGL95_00750 [Patescibacteria group bacterium]|nr:hypothetical protein [Patescibacteria group bacterium]
MEKILVTSFGIVVLIIAIIVGKNMFMPDYKNINPNIQNKIAPSQDSEGTNSLKIIDQLLSKQLSLSCQVDQSGQQTKAYIKNGSVRATFFQNGSQQNIILKDKKIYFWDKTIAAVVNEPTKISSIPLVANQEQNILDLAKNYQKYCKEEKIDDSVFVLPQNLNFKDYSALIN